MTKDESFDEYLRRMQKMKREDPKGYAKQSGYKTS